MIAEDRIRAETCTVCGEVISEPADWGPAWLNSRYCSEPCSERRLGRLDYRLQEAILQLLGRCPEGHPVSAAELARFGDRLGWRSLVQLTCNAGRRLAAKDMVEVESSGSEETPHWSAEDVRYRLPDH